MGVVMSQTPGNEELGKGEDIPEVKNADDLDLEEARGIGCSYREEEIVDGGKNPPAEKEDGLLAV
jgi:hypothetical protein